jgi:hypothetical protein
MSSVNIGPPPYSFPKRISAFSAYLHFLDIIRSMSLAASLRDYYEASQAVIPTILKHR